jgi:phenylacetic acid degradation operon negative regulatory protein
MEAREFPGASAGLWVAFLLGAALPGRPFVPGKGLVDRLDDVGYAAGATRVALSRLCADGSLERRRDGRQTSYRLSPGSAAMLVSVAGRVERFGRNVTWSGDWTIVLASVPDDLRSTRRKLKNGLGYLGFGRLREAAWIAARECESEVKDLLERLDLRDTVDVFVGRPSALADVDAILRRCWDLASLTSRYAAFAAKFGPVDVAGLDTADTVRWWLRLTHDYRDLVHHDPELPPEFLPTEARELRAEVVDLYATLHGRLQGPASEEILRALNA